MLKFSFNLFVFVSLFTIIYTEKTFENERDLVTPVNESSADKDFSQNVQPTETLSEEEPEALLESENENLTESVKDNKPTVHYPYDEFHKDKNKRQGYSKTIKSKSDDTPYAMGRSLNERNFYGENATMIRPNERYLYHNPMSPVGPIHYGSYQHHGRQFHDPRGANIDISVDTENNNINSIGSEFVARQLGSGYGTYYPTGPKMNVNFNSQQMEGDVHDGLWHPSGRSMNQGSGVFIGGNGPSSGGTGNIVSGGGSLNMGVGGSGDLGFSGGNGIAAGVGSGMAVGMGAGASLGAGLGAGMNAGLGAGLGAGMNAGLGAGLGAGMNAGLGAGLGAGINAGLGAGLGAGMNAGLGGGLSAGLGAGLGAGINAGLGAGLDSRINAGFGGGLSAGLGGGLSAGLGGGLSAGLGGGLSAGLGAGLGAGINAGMMGGMSGGMGGGMSAGMAGQYGSSKYHSTAYRGSYYGDSGNGYSGAGIGMYPAYGGVAGYGGGYGYRGSSLAGYGSAGTAAYSSGYSSKYGYTGSSGMGINSGIAAAGAGGIGVGVGGGLGVGLGVGVGGSVGLGVGGSVAMGGVGGFTAETRPSFVTVLESYKINKLQKMSGCLKKWLRVVGKSLDNSMAVFQQRKLQLENINRTRGNLDTEPYYDAVSRKEAELEEKRLHLGNDETAKRIVGGHKVTITKYPYTASYGLICGAAILSNYWLLTAAHCGDNFHTVYTGSTFISRAKKNQIERHIIHPRYKKNTTAYQFDYDYQLLKLKEPLVFSNTQKPIALGTEQDIVVGSTPIVTGWGSTYEEGPTSNHLMAVEVPIISEKSCKGKADGQYSKYISERMFCAGYKEGGRDTCQGDSGGPLVYNNRLIGVVSFGVGCAEPDMPGVYANVHKVKDWIKAETGIAV